MDFIRLTHLVQAVCPIQGLVTSSDMTANFKPEATAPQRAAAQDVYTLFADDVAQAAADNLTARAIAKLLSTTDKTAEGKVLRALAAVLVDEITIVRAALPTPLAARTLTQFKNAIAAKLDAGTVD